MSFAAPIFLWYFLPVVLVATWLTPARARNGIVAVASLVFYAIGGGRTTLLLLVCMAINFGAGVLLQRADERRVEARRAIMIGAVAIDLAALAVWKYAGFASRQVDSLSQALGLGSSPTLEIALPIGISFYTFHQISYVVDVYRRTRPAQTQPLTYVTYVVMFPQLIAGPIVRYHEIADQLTKRTTRRWDDLADGFPRFCLGLTKKVVVADSLAPVVDACFANSSSGLTSGTAWVGAIAYTLQIYFDFSGYSDMAIGLGRMLGFQLPENFARPYSAQSVTDFWRRWHMSLSRWFRDYLYIPLGGNRHGSRRTYANLWTVFLLVGLWHGASWTFVLWGAYHGALLVLERRFGLPARAPAGSRMAVVVRRAAVLLLVMVGWVLFRAESLGDALAVLQAMFWPQGLGLSTEVSTALTHQRTVVLLLAGLVVLLPGSLVLGRVLEFGTHRPAAALRLAVVTVGLGYATVLVAAGTFSPFLYYKF